MKAKLNIILVLALGGMLTISCHTKKQQDGDKQTADSVAQNNAPRKDVPLVPNESLNDAARFVAGLAVGNERSKLYGLTQTAEWKTHSRNMNQIWNSYQQNAPKFLAFTQNELGEVNDGCRTLFYPFGGPDFLFSNAFFPDMDTYFLIGLERTGQPIQVKHPSAKTYRLYQEAVSDVLSLSFFRTRDMNVEAENDTIDGVVPVISMLMARSDKQIISIEYRKIDASGEIVSVNSDGSPITEPTGLVEMKFFRKGGNRLQTLYYYATDLSNEGLKKNAALMAYIRKFNRSTTATFIKSASYLMHEPAFSTIRDLVLDYSVAVLQDDSGIPLPEYKTDKWDITLYGTFYKPVATYAEYPQPELRNAYQLGDPKPLNFRIGYSRQSNLQLARRR